MSAPLRVFDIRRAIRTGADAQFLSYDHLEDDPDRFAITAHRHERFFRDGGLCERYERRGDHLVQFHEIINYLTNAGLGLSRDAVIHRFLFSVKNHWFGRHGRRQTIEQLIDLDWLTYVARRRYSLRPSYIRVETCPELMRARRAVWAQWLQAQGWPVPPELGRSVLIEAAPIEVTTGQSALPSALRPTRQRRPGPAAKVGPRVEAAMRQLPLDRLQKIKQLEMKATFKASESWCREIRAKIVAELGGDPNSA
jgi:hypothetical protein